MKIMLFLRTEEQDNMIFITPKYLGLNCWLGRSIFNLYNTFENSEYLYTII